MIPRCPHCGRVVTRERVRLFGQAGSHPSPWWWCIPCTKRVKPRWTRLGGGGGTPAYLRRKAGRKATR